MRKDIFNLKQKSEQITIGSKLIVDEIDKEAASQTKQLEDFYDKYALSSMLKVAVSEKLG